MITIQQQHIGGFLIFEYLSSLHTVNEKLRFFENKYNNTFESIEKQIKTSKQENFSLWDDYIEWKSYMKVANELSHNINEVKCGNFEVT